MKPSAIHDSESQQNKQTSSEAHRVWLDERKPRIRSESIVSTFVLSFDVDLKNGRGHGDEDEEGEEEKDEEERLKGKTGRG